VKFLLLLKTIARTVG